MPIYVNTKRPEVMEDLLEPALKAFGFEIVYDGSKERKLDPESSPSFFTRVYRWKLDGKFVNTWVKFVYDLRTGRSEFKISNKDFREFQIVRSNGKNTTSEARLFSRLSRVKKLLNLDS